MRGTLKRIIALISVAAMLFCLVVPVYALENSGFIYEVISGGTSVRITGYSGSETDIDVPPTLDGRTVEEISSGAFSGKSGIKSVSLSSNIKRISQEAFRNCSSLERVGIPASVNTISEYAFAGCVSLVDISIESASTAIGFCAFEGCTALKEINIPSTKIGFGAFKNCTSLETIELFQSVQSIGRSAFDGTEWYNAQPKGLLTIGNAVYSYTGDETTVVIPDGMRCIAEFAFYGSGVSAVVIPDGMYYIGSSAFAECKDLSYLSVPSSVISIGTKAFGYVDDTAVSDFIVYCYKDTVAESWSNNNSLSVVNINSCSHEYSEWEISNAPDCINEGTRLRRCVKCNITESEIVEANGHAWSGWVTISELACTVDGVKRRTCTVCGVTEDDVDLAPGHAWDEWEVIKASDCVTQGERKHTCTVCGNVENEKTEPLGHVWTVDASTDENGWIILTEPTCAVDGQKSRVCSVCGYAETEVIEPFGHKADEWIVIKDPTAVTTGTKQGTCNVCGEIFTEEIPVIGETLPDDVKMLTLTANATLKFDESRTCILGVDPGTTVNDVLLQFEYPGHILVTDVTLEEIDGESVIGTGCFLVLVNYSEESGQNEPMDTACVIIKGDVNGDGLISAADARLALQASAKVTTLLSPYFIASDLNADGTITASEVRNILRVASKMDSFE